MSREGGPESAFRLACALEGAGVVVVDAGDGLIGTKVRLPAATGEQATVMPRASPLKISTTTDLLRFFLSGVASHFGGWSSVCVAPSLI